MKKEIRGLEKFYRYGFQNQEVDPEIKGEGNSVNFKYRMHDPRIGRFFAVDPLSNEYPWYSPYTFSGNKVIAWGELEGLEEYYRADGSFIGKVGGSNVMRVVKSSAVEKNIEYAIMREERGKTYTQAKQYNYDVDFAIKNSELMFDPSTIKKQPIENFESGYKKPSKVGKGNKSLVQKYNEWERKSGTESEGSSHGVDIPNNGDGGKFSEYDPFDCWGTSKIEKPKQNDEGLLPKEETIHYEHVNTNPTHGGYSKITLKEDSTHYSSDRRTRDSSIVNKEGTFERGNTKTTYKSSDTIRYKK